MFLQVHFAHGTRKFVLLEPSVYTIVVERMPARKKPYLFPPRHNFQANATVVLCGRRLNFSHTKVLTRIFHEFFSIIPRQPVSAIHKLGPSPEQEDRQKVKGESYTKRTSFHHADAIDAKIEFLRRGQIPRLILLQQIQHICGKGKMSWRWKYLIRVPIIDITQSAAYLRLLSVPQPRTSIDLAG